MNETENSILQLINYGISQPHIFLLLIKFSRIKTNELFNSIEIFHRMKLCPFAVSEFKNGGFFASDETESMNFSLFLCPNQIDSIKWKT